MMASHLLHRCPLTWGRSLGPSASVSSSAQPGTRVTGSSKSLQSLHTLTRKREWGGEEKGRDEEERAGMSYADTRRPDVTGLPLAGWEACGEMAVAPGRDTFFWALGWTEGP